MVERARQGGVTGSCAMHHLAVSSGDCDGDSDCVWGGLNVLFE